MTYLWNLRFHNNQGVFRLGLPAEFPKIKPAPKTCGRRAGDKTGGSHAKNSESSAPFSIP